MLCLGVGIGTLPTRLVLCPKPVQRFKNLAIERFARREVRLPWWSSRKYNRSQFGFVAYLVFIPNRAILAAGHHEAVLCPGLRLKSSRACSALVCGMRRNTERVDYIYHIILFLYLLFMFFMCLFRHVHSIFSAFCGIFSIKVWVRRNPKHVYIFFTCRFTHSAPMRIFSGFCGIFVTKGCWAAPFLEKEQITIAHSYTVRHSDFGCSDL